MAKKWDIDSVREFVESESTCKLLSTEYINAKTKLKFLCVCGNEFEADFDKFKSRNKRQCNDCGYENGKNEMLFTYDKVKSFIELESDSGCKLLSNQYLGSKEQLKLRCQCGGIFKVSYNQFKNNNKRTCNKCSMDARSKNRMFSYDYVKKYIEIESNSGCKLLSNSYNGDRESLSLECKCGNVFYTTLTQFRHSNKRQCNDCGHEMNIAQQRHSYNYILEYIDIISDGSLKLLSKEYINNASKLTFQCSCGEVFDTSFAAVQKGKAQCNKCSREELSKKQRLSYEYVKDYIENKYSDWQKLKLLSEGYKNAHDKLVLMDSDGFKYSTSLSNLKDSYKKHLLLPFSVHNKYTIDNMHNWLKLSENTNMLLSTEYNGNKNKLLWECANGHQFEALWGNIRKGHGCPICAGQSKPTMDFIRQEFENRGYTLLSNRYINNTSKLKFVCHIHKNEGAQDIAWGNFYNQGNGCYYCGREKIRLARLKTNEEFIKEVYNSVGEEYVFIEEYINSKIKIKCQHNSCGNIYDVAPTDFLSGSRCPSCNQSKGERAIERYLKNNNINYQLQYRIDECRNINTLPFDFAIFDDIGNLIALIEYDGEQHYTPIDFAGKGKDWAENEYRKTKKNDKIKSLYCRMNGINLITIPYWDLDKTDEILNQRIFNSFNKAEIS